MVSSNDPVERKENADEHPHGNPSTKNIFPTVFAKINAPGA